MQKRCLIIRTGACENARRWSVGPLDRSASCIGDLPRQAVLANYFL